MSTETLDKLFLELSQFTTATTEKELALLNQRAQLIATLRVAEAALADIGDSDNESTDDLQWCESRAAQALPLVRQTLKPYSN